MKIPADEFTHDRIATHGLTQADLYRKALSLLDRPEVEWATRVLSDQAGEVERMCIHGLMSVAAFGRATYIRSDDLTVMANVVREQYPEISSKWDVIDGSNCDLVWWWNDHLCDGADACRRVLEKAAVQAEEKGL